MLINLLDLDRHECDGRTSMNRDEETGELRKRVQVLEERLATLRGERDTVRRLFDKLEHAITFHQRDQGLEFATSTDLRLWVAHQKIMSEYANGGDPHE
jgi:hypothetical protein